MRKLSCVALLLVGFVVAGCDEPKPDDEGDGPTMALFEVPRGSAAVSDFYALPFPNDIRRDDAGHPMVADYPRPVGIVGDYVDAIATLDGFGTNNAIFQRFSAEIDLATLPGDPAASLLPAASVYLVDIDPTSAARGERIPLVFRFQTFEGFTIGANWLSALPFPGFPMREHTTYALVVTTRLLGPGNLALARAADFTQIAGTDAVDGELRRARERYAPLWTWLDEPGGDERDDVVSAAVFTTQSVTAIMGQLRDKVYTLPAPVMRDVEPREIVDVPFTWYDGVVDAPNFQTGEVPYRGTGGDIVFGDDDLPAVQRMEPIRVSFTIPEGTMPPDGWPVVIYGHGTGGGHHSFVADATASRLADLGLAVLSFDQVLHGPRNPGGDPEIDFFNFLNPVAGRNNPIQGAVDGYTMVRLVEGFERVETEPVARTIKFDPARISFFGHSQGGLTGPPFLAFEPKVRGAVLSGAGGLLYYALLHKTEPVDIRALVGSIVLDNPLDEFNPVLALLQMWIERSDTINYGPLLVREPPDGLPPMDIYQSMGFVDHFTPLPDIEALAVAIGGNHVGPAIEPIEGLALRDRPLLTAPVTGNLDGHTAVLVQYEATSSDGHFVVFDTAAGRRQSAQFLGTLAHTGTATLVTAE